MRSQESKQVSPIDFELGIYFIERFWFESKYEYIDWFVNCFLKIIQTKDFGILCCLFSNQKFKSIITDENSLIMFKCI